MTDLREMLCEYHHSCRAVRERIHDLNERISGREALWPGETLKVLERRRYVLYCELAEMSEAICSLEEYLEPELAAAANL